MKDLTEGSTLGTDDSTARDGLKPLPTERFQIEEKEVARGGLGRILKAWDTHLSRWVALKVPLPGKPEARHRLAREALITARLQHPSIVPVYEAGRWPSGEPFYAMRLVEGRSLKQALSEAGDYASRLALLPHLIAVAEAVAYAHKHRVIHRDLKPSNVFVGELGETVVLDWGLSVELDNAESIRDDAGLVVGTPRYMSPEQAAGQSVDQRSDVYALGAMLYHSLTGVAPHEGESSSEILERLSLAEPVPVEAREARVPADLAAIVKKAMARHADDRYATAEALAADLHRFNTGQLVSSHQYSPAALVGRFVRRHVALVSVTSLLITALTVVGVISIRQVARARREAEHRRDELLLQQARHALASDPTAAAAWLKEYPREAAGWPDARMLLSEAKADGVARHIIGGAADWVLPHGSDQLVFAGSEIEWFDFVSGRHFRTGSRPRGDFALAPAPDGSVVLVDDAGLSRCRREAGCSPVWRRDGGDVLVRGDVSPDGSFVAAHTTGGAVRIFRMADGSFRELGGHTAEVFDIRVSRDGKWVVTGSADRSAKLWNVATGESRVLGGHTDTVRAVPFSPDAKQVATASHDGTLRLWNLAGGEGKLMGRFEALFAAEFSPDGRYLAAGGADHEVRVWDLASGELRTLHGHEQTVMSLAFSPDGRLLASGSEDRNVRLWDLQTGAVSVLRGHNSAILTLRFSDDGRWLTSMGFGNQLRVWRVSQPAGRVVARADGDVVHASFTPDGRRAAIGSNDKSVRLCPVDGGSCRVLGSHAAPVTSIAISPDGKRLASASGDATVRLWDLDGDGSVELKGHTAPVKRIVFSPDGNQLASASEDRTIRLWDLASNSGRVAIRHDDMASVVAFSRDGRFLASAGFDRVVRVLDLRSNKPLEFRGHESFIMSVAFSPDSSRVASAGYDGTVGLWDLAHGGGRRLEGHEQPIMFVSFAPDGRSLASCSLDKTIRLWDPVSGRGQVLGRHDGAVKRVVFSPDGTWLASAGDDRAVRVWDPRTGEGRMLGAHEAILRGVAFSPDGKSILSAGNDHLARLWSLDGVGELPSSPSADQAWLADLTSAVLVHDEPITP